MGSRIIGCLAGAVIAAAASAQDRPASVPAPGRTPTDTVTMVGCVRPALAPIGTTGSAAPPSEAARYVLTSTAERRGGKGAAAAAAAPPTSSVATGRPDEATGRADAAASDGMLLEGTADVAKYVGQQVEVTGTIAAAELPLAGVPDSPGGRTGSAGAPGSPARAGALEADAARGTEAVVGHHGDEPVVSSLSAPAQRMRVTAVRPVGGRCAP